MSVELSRANSRIIDVAYIEFPKILRTTEIVKLQTTKYNNLNTCIVEESYTKFNNFSVKGCKILN
jgi:hypothetical protein